MSSENLRVIVIGLDGATFDLILPWVEGGLLPTFKRVMEEGSWGGLQSTMPPLTGPAWSSFITGKNPGKHGIFDFMRRNPEGYNWTTINATHRKGPSFWRVLGDHGRRVTIFNVPCTYPPEEVNGVMISGYLTPPKATDFVFPQELKKDLEECTGFHSTFYPGATYALGREERFIQAVDEVTGRTIRVMDFLMERFPSDCLVGVFQSPDLLQHCIWKDIHDPILGRALLNLYKKIDGYLRKVLSNLDEHTMLLIMSDHGFGDLKKQIFLNTWLLSKGFLRLKPGVTGRIKKGIFHMGLVPMKLHQLSIRLGMDLSNELMENRDSLFSFLSNVCLSFDDVDWDRTKAYGMGNMGYIFINLQGREPRGCVKPGEDYQKILKEITRELYGMRDPETDQPIIEHVFSKGDLYSGPYLTEAPDLFPMPMGFRYHLRGDYVFISNHWIEKFWLISGFHRPEGILMAIGRDVRKGWRIEGKSVMDVAPTILAYLDVPIPSDMDGQILFDIFVNEFSDRMTPSYAEPPREDKRDEKTLSEQEQAEIRKRLKGLGYVG